MNPLLLTAKQDRTASDLELGCHNIRNYIKHQYETNQLADIAGDITTVYLANNPAIEPLPVLDAVNYSIANHTTVRGNGDHFVSHPLTAAYIATFFGGDTQTCITDILHDIIEENYSLKERLSNEISTMFGPIVTKMVLAMTGPGYAHQFLKKQTIANQIHIAAHDDPLKRLYLVRCSDRISNLLTADGLVGKNGLNSQEVRGITIADTLQNVVPMATEVDKIYKSPFSVEGYLKDLIVSKFSYQNNSAQD